MDAEVPSVMSDPAVFDQTVSLVTSVSHLKFGTHLIPPNHSDIQWIVGASFQSKVEIRPY